MFKTKDDRAPNSDCGQPLSRLFFLPFDGQICGFIDIFEFGFLCCGSGNESYPEENAG
jgi:hypothetical protein